jgi:ABC-type phosphate transport system substrate-binding protein
LPVTKQSGVIVFVKQLVATGLAILVTIGLTACDPPMPPELLASQAEQSVTCIDGELTVATPTAISDVVDGWASSLSGACAGSTLTKLDDADGTAQAIISMDGQISPACKPFAEFPIAIDGGVVAYVLADAPTLNLTPQNIQDIFSGKVTNWSDPSLAPANPDAVLPDLAIHIVGGPQQIAVDALTNWFKKLGVDFKPTLAKTAAKDDGAALATMAEGDIAITSFSNALYAFSTVAAVTVGKDPIAESAIADISGIQRGADISGAKPGDGEAPAYAATYPINMYLCGTDNQVARAIGRYLIRQDSQGSLGAAVVAPLPESIRMKAIAVAAKGLPKPKS